DGLHANVLGSFLANTTVLATVLGQNPQGVPVPAEYWGTPSLTQQRIEIFQRIVWDVVSNHPYTGVVAPRVGDVNGDGDVDHLDLAIWQSDYDNQPVLRADANGDLRVDELDLAYWQLSLEPTPQELAANFNG